MSDTTSRLREVVALFLRLGSISFGGPAAHIALMERECTRQRSWLTREHFLSLLAATNLVPGPNATEMAIHIGYVRAGWAGLLAGGIAFILPAFVLSLALGVLYMRMGALPQVAAVFYGINPVVVAIVLTATYRLGRTAVREGRTLMIFIACVVAALAGVNEVVLIFLAGGLSLLASVARWRVMQAVLPVYLLAGWQLPPLLADIVVRPPLPQLFLFFLKVGSLMFGSGMVLFAYVQKDLVVNLGWLSQQQLLDAIAVGQMTPGPVLSSVTFIGYLLAGIPGALLATVGAFLPSFIIVALMGPWMLRLRRSVTARQFLDGVNAAVVALMAVVAFALLHTAIIDVWTATLLALVLLAILRYNIDTIWLVLAGGLVGLLLTTYGFGS